MRRLLVTIFTLAFALGAVGAFVFTREHVQQAAVVPAVQAPDRDKADAKDSTEQWPDDAGSPEQVMYAQPQLMQDAVQRLLPRTPEKANLYLVGFAGDGDENVFRNEVEFVERQFVQRFDAAGHTLLLINNPATVAQRPLASLTNLGTAIDAAAGRMDPDQDILLLFLTSHGSREHELYVGLDPLPLDQITPQDLSDLFADSPIRYRVIVISACYSGGFIDALKNDTTMIITAARADRASFGCGTESEITDFGRAFFVEGLNNSDSFPAAFATASSLIDAWETRDDEEHSLPQFATTPQIEARLKAWRSGIRLGPPVPFKAAAPPPHPDDGSLTAATFRLH
ncbi:MAG: C13 family peptidase [Rudaea sp.]|nr:C13 family peptidase [Rudaea sp.]